jgi:hypothetical protein
MIKSNRHVSEVITVSDEAYAILISKSNLMSWITNGLSEIGKANSPSVACVGKANSNNGDINVKMVMTMMTIKLPMKMMKIKLRMQKNFMNCVPTLKTCGLWTNT